jgi:hypothetical protein
MSQTTTVSVQPQLDVTFRLAEAMLTYARQVLESQLDTVQSLLAEGAATSRILSRDAEMPKAEGALLAQLAQANAQHWSHCARRVAEATMKTQAECVKLVNEHTRLASPPFGMTGIERLDGIAAQLLQPLQLMLELLTNATRPWVDVPDALASPARPTGARTNSSSAASVAARAARITR